MLKKHFYTFISSIFICFSCDTKNNNSLSKNEKLNPKVDSVKVFVYDGLRGQEIITEDKKIDSTVVCELKLNKNQEQELFSILSINSTTIPDSLAEIVDCFTPSYAIVTFQNGQPFQWCSICFVCNTLKTNMAINAYPSQLVPYFIKLNLTNNQINFSKHLDNEFIIQINKQRYGSDYEVKRGY